METQKDHGAFVPEAEEMDAISGVLRGGGGMRTVFVFLDLPRHVEFQAGEMPLIPQGEVVTFDVSLRNHRDPRKTRKVEGEYRLKRRALRYSTSRASSSGMTQYLEWEPVPRG